MKVYICEDDKDILELLIILVEELGYSTVSCSNFKNITHDIIMHNPNLIIMDYWLRETKADNIIIEIKQNPVINNIPLILISAIDNIVEIGKKLEVNDVIQKPFDINELQSKVIKLLN